MTQTLSFPAEDTICHRPLNPSPPLQVNLKMRVRLSYSRLGAAFQDTIQVDSFPGLGY